MKKMKNSKILKLSSFLLSFLLISLVSCENLDSYTDKLGPSQITNVQVSSIATGNAVEFLWTDPQDSDFDHIEVEYKLNGVAKTIKVDSGTEYLYVDGLSHEMGYQFAFYSVDKNGNKSAAKNVGAFSTEFNGGYMMSYFKSNSDGNSDYESLFLASSADGLNYTALLNNTYFYKINASVGSGNTCVRDPYMNRLHDNNKSDKISYFVYLATDWTGYGSASYSKEEYGTTGFTSYWDSNGYSPSLIVSVVKVDTENNTVDFYKPVSGDLYGGTENGSLCKRMITIPADVIKARGRPMHAWAPEIILDYDEQTGASKPVYTDTDGTEYYYGIIWSGNGDAVIQNADSSYQEIVTSKALYSGEKTIDSSDFDASVYTEGWICRTFVNYTNDFYNYTTPKFYFENVDIGDFDNDRNTEEPVSEIDASMIKVDDVFYMPYKGEASGATDINMAKSVMLEPNTFIIMHKGQWITRTTDQFTDNGIEGPWMILDTSGRWWLFGDQYGRGKPTGTNNFVGTVSSKIDAAPKYWSYHDNDGTYSMPTGVRHSFAFRVTAEEMAAFSAISSAITY